MSLRSLRYLVPAALFAVIAAFLLLGLKPGDAPGNPETFFRYIHPGDLELVKARWEEASRS